MLLLRGDSRTTALAGCVVSSREDTVFTRSYDSCRKMAAHVLVGRGTIPGQPQAEQKSVDESAAAMRHLMTSIIYKDGATTGDGILQITEYYCPLHCNFGRRRTADNRHHLSARTSMLSFLFSLHLISQIHSWFRQGNGVERASSS
ncbi:hypothetical protein CLAIMM_13182 [Cladophialophora immunda]|nr:hypothetical protein CLAIMM_13182 [Cladophialophora immunda]